ncbi:RICIN domain-containing protein [Streptomyces sp. CA-243310]|uniref:RICIN domain-containing protein n=1 Tax=Streptomyces sp. CA-243310 TaxID=3240056 RepID=UPI003D911C51
MTRRLTAALVALLTVLGFNILGDEAAVAAGGTRLYNSGNCATPQGNSGANGTVITTWSCTGSNLQNWHWVSDSIVHDASGRCLTPRGNATNTNGAVLTLWDCTGSPAQNFAGNSGRTWTVNGVKCLTNKGGSQANGTWVTLWQCSPEFNYGQSWGLVR